MRQLGNLSLTNRIQLPAFRIIHFHRLLIKYRWCEIVQCNIDLIFQQQQQKNTHQAAYKKAGKQIKFQPFSFRTYLKQRKINNIIPVGMYCIMYNERFDILKIYSV